MARLMGMSVDVKGQIYELENEITIGRAADNTISIQSPSVSSHHCRVVRQDNDYVLQDNNSTNGTRVNSKEAKEVVLKHRDLLQAGSVEFMFQDEGAAGGEEAMPEADVEVTAGPTAAPASFANISPFGAKTRETRGLMFSVLLGTGIIAALAVAFFLFCFVTIG